MGFSDLDFVGCGLDFAGHRTSLGWTSLGFAGSGLASLGWAALLGVGWLRWGGLLRWEWVGLRWGGLASLGVP